MKYSSGNHRRGKGRNIRRRSHGSPEAMSPESQLTMLQTQLRLAEKAGLNVSIYQSKLDALLTAYPELQGEGL